MLPHPETLPRHRSGLAAAVTATVAGHGVLAAFGAPAARAALRQALTPPPEPDRDTGHPGPPGRPDGLPGATVGPPSPQAQAEQREHDRYFAVGRVRDEQGRRFVAGLVLAHLSAYENCLDMGVTLLDGPDWELLFGGLRTLLDLAPGDLAGDEHPRRPSPAGWREGYDPAARWLVGHQLFFALIQGAIIGLNSFAAADEAGAQAAEGLALAAAFLRSSAVAMKLASDFAPADYEATVRPAMTPPKVREGFSGLQTRDHAYLVRLFGALKPALAAARGLRHHGEFVESVVSAYAAHEFICARFRGNVLPSLRMAAATRGKSQRPGTEVIREMMRARLALIDPACHPGSCG